MYRLAGIEFDRTELRDLGLAWFALAIAFTLFLTPISSPRQMTPGYFVDLFPLFVMSLATVGSGFLLHELAHKVVAIRFGQVAAFRADYTMLGLAVASGLAGFLIAAPGAVYHRGRITTRENGLVAVAGPVTNIALAVVFLLVFLLVDGFLSNLARMGVLINVFLGAFNMIPFGPLDGRTVLDWSGPVYTAVLLSAVSFGAAFIFLL
jgi:Zn-dependent protease